MPVPTLPNRRRRRNDHRRAQLAHTPENQLAQILAVRLVSVDSIEVEFDRPVTCLDTTTDLLQIPVPNVYSNEWAQTSPRTWEVQLTGSAAEGDAWESFNDSSTFFSPNIAPSQSGVVLPN
jgi:hypothetical protein